MQVLWTIITLFIYLICSQIPLYGSLRWRIFRFSASTLFENHGIVVGSDLRGRSISRAYYQRTRSARSREEKHRRGTESSSESNFWRSSSSAKVIQGRYVQHWLRRPLLLDARDPCVEPRDPDGAGSDTDGSISTSI